MVWTRSANVCAVLLRFSNVLIRNRVDVVLKGGYRGLSISRKQFPKGQELWRDRECMGASGVFVLWSLITE